MTKDNQTPRERLEHWHLSVSEGYPEPERLFQLAELTCDALDDMQLQRDTAMHACTQAELERDEARKQVRSLRELVSSIKQRFDLHDGDCLWVREGDPCECAILKRIAHARDMDAR